MPSTLDVFSKYGKASWRGIEFPVLSLGLSFDHDHAQHKYPDRDGAFIESTGRNAMVHKVTACFRNGVLGERLLYPSKWRDFVRACADRSAGELVHPELGTLRVKCKSYTNQWDVLRRDGVDVEVEFVEAPEEGDDATDALAANSPIGNCVDAARTFDGAYGTLKPGPPKLPESLSPSLLESVKQLQGTIAQARLSAGNVVSQIDGMASAVSDLADAIAGQNDPRNHGAIAALERLWDALGKLGKEFVTKARPVIPRQMPRTLSVSEAAAAFSMSVQDFCSLNPLVADRETVAAGTVVFVYVT